jgi:hypothetical protein
MATTTPTLSLDDFKKLIAEEERAATKKPSESIRLDYAVTALNTMRGLDMAEKRMIVRRMMKILSR